MDAICPSAIESLVRIWSALHSGLSIEISSAEARYVREVVLGMDDELVARLLAAKLAMSRQPTDCWPADDLARCGSEVLYSVQGRHRRARLVHGSADEDGSIGVETRFGAALVGLRSGQSLLWPHEMGRLVEVQALEVARGRPRANLPRSIQRYRSRRPCASG